MLTPHNKLIEEKDWSRIEGCVKMLCNFYFHKEVATTAEWAKRNEALFIDEFKNLMLIMSDLLATREAQMIEAVEGMIVPTNDTKAHAKELEFWFWYRAGWNQAIYDAVAILRPQQQEGCCNRCNGGFTAKMGVQGMGGFNHPCKAAYKCECHQQQEGKHIVICSKHGNAAMGIPPTHFCRFKIDEPCHCPCTCKQQEEVSN